MTEESEPSELNRATFSSHAITALLRRLSAGDVKAISRVMSLLYTDLKDIAGGKLRRERPDHTLEPAALVNELYIQLARKRENKWQNRQHFLNAASQEMRRLLVDYARAHNSKKRGGGLSKTPFDELAHSREDNLTEFLFVNDLLDRLALDDPRMARVVEMRCFGGLTNREIAEVLDVDERTVKRDWRFAKPWLESQIRKYFKNVKRGMGPG